MTLSAEATLSRALFDNRAVGVALLDADLRYVVVNDTLAAMNGIAAEDHIGKTPMELLPGVESAVFDALQTAVRTGAATSGRMLTGTTQAEPGRARSWVVSYDPTFDPDGELIGVCAVVIETTVQWRQEQRTEQLERLAAALAIAVDRDAAIDAVLASAVTVLEATGAAVMLLDEDGRPELAGAVGYDPALIEDVRPMDPMQQARLLGVIASGEPLFLPVEEVVSGLGPDVRRRMEETGSRSFAVVPIVGRDGPIGAFVASFATQREGDPDERRWVRAVAQVFTQAFERAGLYDRERRDRRRAETLATLTAALAGASTPADVSGIIVRTGLETLGASAAAAGLIDTERNAFVAESSAGYDPAVTESFADLPLDTATPIVVSARTGQPYFFETHDEWPADLPFGRDEHVATGFATAVILPLGSPERPLGAFALSYRQRRRFDADERRFMTAVARICGQALERAHFVRGVELARSLLQQVVDQMPVGVLVAEAPSGRIVNLNAQMARIFGVDPTWTSVDDYLAWPAFRPDGTACPPGEQPIARTLHQGETVRDEDLQIERADGRTGWMTVSSTPVRDDAGRMAAVVLAAADITARREREALRDAFLGVVSHELRTPITSLVAASRLLAGRKELGDPERDLADDLVVESDRLSRIVDNLLVIARIERGVDLSIAEPTLLQRVLPRIVEIEQRRWPEVQFDVSLAESLATVSGDPAYTHQVVGNLLSNAAKYAGAAGPIVLEAVNEGRTVAVRVVDRGPGIDANPLETVFELFYRSGSTASVAPGAGIGLCVVRHLVEAMGGTIWVANRDGGGAEFGFRLPVVPDETDGDAADEDE